MNIPTVYIVSLLKFVILNNYYAVANFNKNVYHDNMDRGLYNTKFKVSIFNDSGSIEHGQLMIYFPPIGHLSDPSGASC